MLDRRLKYVVATARFGSFTAAAGQVGVTQSAITKSVADIEGELGYCIFDRTARGVLLTEEGRLFVERATRLLDDARDLMRGGSALADPYAGPLRIGVGPASLEWLLVEPLSALLSRHPSIRLNIVRGSHESAVQQLRAGAVDVALGYEAAFLTQPDLTLEVLPLLPTVFFVRKEHPVLRCEVVTGRELAKYSIISSSGSSPYDYIWHEIYEKSGVDPHDRIHFVDYHPIVESLVRATDAVGVAAVPYTGTDRFNARFARVPFEDALPSFPLCCATRARWRLRPAVRAFTRACREHLPLGAG